MSVQNVIGWLGEHLKTAEQVTAFFTAVIGLTGIGALWFAARQLRHARGEAQIQHLLDLIHTFESDQVRLIRKAAASERSSGEMRSLRKLLDFFEIVGLLVRRGYLDKVDVWEAFGYWIFNIYSEARHEIDEQQRLDKNLYTNFMFLHGKLVEVEKVNDGTFSIPSPEDLDEFWKDERIEPHGILVPRPRHRLKSKGKPASS